MTNRITNEYVLRLLQGAANVNLPEVLTPPAASRTVIPQSRPERITRTVDMLPENVTGPCRRCNGTGQYRTFGACFRCEGTGREPARHGAGWPADAVYRNRRAPQSSPATQPIEATALFTAMRSALGRNRRIRLRVHNLQFEMLATRNDQITVRNAELRTWYGRIIESSAGEEFEPSRFGMATSDVVREIEHTARDPRAAAVAHGRMTGACAICSRTLTDPDSVALGIGPICAGRMGWR